MRLVGDAGPSALLAGLFVLTAILGPADQQHGDGAHRHPDRGGGGPAIGLSPRPVLMSVAIAAAASFLTPVATPVNLMVMGPGGYRFGDYWKLGLPLMLWFFLVATFYVPVFWRL